MLKDYPNPRILVLGVLHHPLWDGKFLDDWCRQVMRSRIEPMKKMEGSLRQHLELILN